MAKIIGPQQMLSDQEFGQVFQLWNSEYPIGINYPSLETFQEFLKNLGDKKHYLIKAGNELSGWLMSFDRNDGRWFSIIISPRHQKKGIGKELLQFVMSHEQNLQGWVVDHDGDVKADGSPYPSPIDFYVKLGFGIYPEQRFEKPGISCVKIQQHEKAVHS